MNRYWALLFALVPILGVGLYVIAFLGTGAIGGFSLEGLWLPDNANPKTWAIDHLFDLVHVICGVILGLTTSILAYLVWRYADHPGRTPRPAVYVTHNHLLEWTWTLIPAMILIFLAFYQLEVWEDNKMNRPTRWVNGQVEAVQPLALVVAKQFGWEFYYPGPDQKLGTVDDIRVENELVLPTNQAIVLRVESKDVLHSFAIPGFRIKQDVVPGMTQLVWFEIDKPGKYEILCMELCGWGHYKMRAQIVAVDSPVASNAIVFRKP